MEFKRCKTAIVGCGAISDAYMKSIQTQFSILEVIACTDLDVSRMQKTAETYKLKAMTYDEILADPEIELVLNLTNPVAHYALTKQALEHGKNVYSEKMIAVELSQGEELLSLAREKHLRLGVAPDTFLGAAIQTARYVLDTGLIGKPLTATASISRDYGVFGEVLPHLRKKGAGILFDMGGYYLTALASLFGAVREVAAFTATNKASRNCARVDDHCKSFGQPYDIEVSNLVTAVLKYDCGILSTLHMNSDCIFDETTGIVVYGTEGIMYMSDPNLFGGEVRVKKMNAPEIVFPLTHGFREESRGIGAAELAWAMRLDRPHRAHMDMAFNVFETAHMIERSSVEKRTLSLNSRFKRPAPLPSGFIVVEGDDAFWCRSAESALAQ